MMTDTSTPVSGDVLVFGPNPAWQRRFECPALTGEVVRGRGFPVLPAGKGANCATALKIAGLPVTLLTGSDRDGTYAKALDAARLRTAVFPLEGPVRTATTVHETTSGRTTELVEEGPAAAPEAMAAVSEALRSFRGAAIAALGSLPAGLPVADLARELGSAETSVILDSVALIGALEPTPRERLWLKMNGSEWKKLGGSDDLETALAAAQERFPGARIIATLGAEGAAGWQNGTLQRFFLPDATVRRGHHPIGAGDAFAAGLAAGIARGETERDTLAFALAISWASCLDPRPAHFDPAEAAKALPSVSFS